MSRLQIERFGKVVRGGVAPRINKHRSNIYPIVQSDLPRNSTDSDMHYERAGEMRAQKYLRESCYHCIECSVANSLTVLMRK